MQNYNTLPISVFILTAYFISHTLSKTGKISVLTHRRLWNVVLLISFLISASFGLILAFFIDQKLNLPWYLNFLWLHVELGIVMAIVSIFHLLWHLPYYLSIFRNRR